MSDKLKISKRSNIKGDDGYKVFSVRIKEDVVVKSSMKYHSKQTVPVMNLST